MLIRVAAILLVIVSTAPGGPSALAQPNAPDDLSDLLGVPRNLQWQKVPSATSPNPAASKGNDAETATQRANQFTAPSVWTYYPEYSITPDMKGMGKIPLISSEGTEVGGVYFHCRRKDPSYIDIFAYKHEVGRIGTEPESLWPEVNAQSTLETHGGLVPVSIERGKLFVDLAGEAADRVLRTFEFDSKEPTSRYFKVSGFAQFQITFVPEATLPELRAGEIQARFSDMLKICNAFRQTASAQRVRRNIPHNSAKAQGPPEELPYGSRIGMNVTVVGKSGVDSKHAVVFVQHTPKNAREFCVEHSGDPLDACVKKLIKEEKLKNRIFGDCLSGRFTDLRGETYRFEGPGTANLEYIIRRSTGEVLDVCTVCGYVEALEAFRALCPAAVNSGKVFAPPDSVPAIIRCTAENRPDVVMALNTERKFGRLVSCIRGEFISDMTPCAPDGGFGLSAASGSAPLVAVVYNWKDYTDHVGGVTSLKTTSSEILFSGEFLGRISDPSSRPFKKWDFTANRLTGVAKLKVDGEPDAPYACARGVRR